MRPDLIKQSSDWYHARRGIPRRRGPEPRNAAHRCRDANRALRVFRHAQRSHAGRDGYPSSSAASAGNSFWVVRIVYGAESKVVTRPSKGQFVEIGLAQHDRSGIDKRADYRRIYFWTEAAKRGCSPGCREILSVDAVFYRNRQTVERAELRSRPANVVRRAGRLEDARRLQCDEGVQRL